MTETPSITCAKNGPLLVKGLERLVDLRDGSQLATGETVALCRCGGSSNRPYCDGTHAGNGFDDAPGEKRPRDVRRDYVGEGITVHDNRRACSHAAFCVERLPAVFRMKERPWIAPDNASVEEVKAAVDACPSGALSYTLDGVEHRDHPSEPGILVAPGGPFAVQGGVRFEGHDWAEGASREHYNLCRCGASANKPFCDGAHRTIGFE